MKHIINIQFDDINDDMSMKFEGSPIIHSGMLRYAGMKIEVRLLASMKLRPKPTKKTKEGSDENL